SSPPANLVNSPRSMRIHPYRKIYFAWQSPAQKPKPKSQLPHPPSEFFQSRPNSAWNRKLNILNFNLDFATHRKMKKIPKNPDRGERCVFW
ncbi:MAG: hypothetical protein D6814_08350, partial [Calditrichaeota bacterium]